MVRTQHLPGKITDKHVLIIYETEYTDCRKALLSFPTTKKGTLPLHSAEKILMWLTPCGR